MQGSEGVGRRRRAAVIGASSARGRRWWSRRGSARGWWQRGQAVEGARQFARPRPAALEAQRGAAGVEDQAAGGVEQAVAQRLGFADGELAVEGEALGPGDEVWGDERELEPDGVVVEVAERQILQPGLLGGTDAILGVGAGAMQALELDRVTGQIGQGGQEAVTVVIGEAQLRAGMRALATDDDAGPLGPATERQAVTDLGHPGALAPPAVLADGRAPRRFGRPRMASRTASVRS